MEFLEEVNRHCRSYQVPVVGVSLPILGRRSPGGEDSVELSLSSSPTLFHTPTVLCQVYITHLCSFTANWLLLVVYYIYYWSNEGIQRNLIYTVVCVENALVDVVYTKAFLIKCQPMDQIVRM